MDHHVAWDAHPQPRRLGDLTRKVMHLLKKGWSVAGVVSVVAGTGYNAGTLTYLQALTGPGEIERC